MSDSELYPIAILIHELKNDDVQLRLNSMKRLHNIAFALGAERTRNELIPFLEESCLDDEDDVLLELARQMGSDEMIKACGGVQWAVQHNLKVLEYLCKVEEQQVRDEAMGSVVRIIGQLGNSIGAKNEELLVSMIERLTQKWLTSRSSACGLMGSVYAVTKNENTRKNLRSLYEKMAHDETPMVRRSAAKYLGEFAKHVGKSEVNSDIIPIFLHLKQDDQDSVRLLAIDNCIALSQILDAKDTLANILPTIKNCAADKSWRVRYMVADNFHNLAKGISETTGDNQEIVSKELVSSFIKLCQDVEVEVRTAAAFRSTDFCAFVPKDQIISEILPCIKQLVNDKSEHVRASLAKVIMGASPLLSKDATIKHLLPLFLKLLKDDYPDARLNIIGQLESVNSVIGVDLLAQSLLPAIVKLAEDKNWRIRKAIIEMIPLLASQLGVKFFDEKLSTLCTSWLTDKVASIREAGTQNLKKLTEIFGADWAHTNLLPKIIAISSYANYLHRITALSAISSMVDLFNSDIIVDKILGIVLDLTKDRVPNVRFNAVISLQHIAPHVSGGILQERIIPILKKLQQDEDIDVQRFSTTALLSVQ